MKKITIAATILLAGFCSAATAQPYYPDRAGMRAQIAEMNAPRTILKQGLTSLIAFLQQNQKPSKEQVTQFLDKQVAPYFDFAYMARWAGGQRWAGMSTNEKLQMEARIQQMFLSTLAQNLSSYDNQQVRIMRPRRGQGNEVSIDVAIMNPRGYPARLKFRFYNSPNGWRIFDVAANGNSATMHYRKVFNRAAQPMGRGYPVRR